MSITEFTPGNEVALATLQAAHDSALAAKDAVIAEMQLQIDFAFQTLDVFGVPRYRAKSIHNGIGVLEQRTSRELLDTQARLAEATALLREMQDANFNEVMECEDDSWMDKVDAFLEPVSASPTADQREQL